MAPLKLLIVLSSGAAALALGLGAQFQAQGPGLMALIANAWSALT
ncbi:hypothetical protein [Phenylobacterium sp.]|nr:hypothetical protein [Phenylobacterium sp.]